MVDVDVRSLGDERGKRRSELWLRDSEEIQGHVLAGFKKDYQAFLFVRFPVEGFRFPDAAQGRAWLANLLQWIATTRAVADFNWRFSQARRQRGGDDPERLKARWTSIGLTYEGLVALGPSLEGDLHSFTAYREGAAARAADNGDNGRNAPEQWLIGRSDQDVHAIVTLAADERSDLLVALDRLRALNAAHGVLTLFEQRGETLPGVRAGSEHFGFRDGISQPGVQGFDPQDPASGPHSLLHPEPEPLHHLGSRLVAPGEFVLGYRREPDRAGDTSPRPHPLFMKDGSFQVFRRLAQDVPGFWAQVTAHAQSLAFEKAPTADLLAAKLVGRWRSGTPLDRAPHDDNRPQRDPDDDNDFQFEGDPEGFRCPRFAHIRKMNPRDTRTFNVNRHRLLRRGIPFGPPFDPASGRGAGVDAKRGLCFLSFMSSIEDQFEFLQRHWANAPDFPPGERAGPDPLIGDATRPAPVRLRIPPGTEHGLEFRRFVETEGAVYAFLPSSSTLRELAAGRYR
jgi:Dyp-type peroxidase family